jgi:aldehyde:ferredoxin oxidoreductase
MAKAYAGTGLRIDLSTGNIVKEKFSRSDAKTYVGGYLLGMKLLYDEYRQGTDAFDPENPLIFCTGPLTGTTAPTGSSITCHTKSPLSTFVASRAGGHLGPELKFAGYDYIVIKGKAKKPVWLWIDDDTVELRSAGNLWGRLVQETDESIKGIVGDKDIETLIIGPAGEKKVRISTINCNVDRAFGRGGPGAVMGSKNLKAIGIRGSKSLVVANPKRFKRAVAQNMKDLKERDDWSWSGMPKVGTSSWMSAVNYYNMLPVKNFQENHSDSISGGLDEEAYVKKLKIRPYACFNCPLTCSHYAPTIQEGKYAGTSSGTIEYETAAGLGARCGIRDIQAVAKATELCAQYGIDTISCGSVIAWAMECSERKLLTAEESCGMDLFFGNANAMVDLVEKIGNREGLGDLLAEGTLRAANKIGKGTKAYAMQVKGLEISASSPRTSKSNAVMFAVNERGGHHMDPYAATIDAYGYINKEAGLSRQLNPYEAGDSGDVFVLKKYTKLADILGTCAFTVINLQTLPSTYSELFSAGTGIELSGNQLLEKGEMLITLMRAFNAINGFTAKDDTLPDRFTKEPISINVPEELRQFSNGKSKITRVVDLEKNLADYYKTAGYDRNTGLPSEKRFRELGLGEVAKDLKNKGICLA